MIPSITSVELQRVCRAWEMNNGTHGWEDFNENKYPFSWTNNCRAYDEWVDEKSFHKSYLNYGWQLIEWLLKKSEA